MIYRTLATDYTDCPERFDESRYMLLVSSIAKPKALLSSGPPAICEIREICGRVLRRPEICEIRVIRGRIFRVNCDRVLVNYV